MLEPDFKFIHFANNDERKEKRRNWKLPIRKALMYKGIYSEKEIPCELVGYNEDETTIVISMKGNLHCISPGYLANMQKLDFDRAQMRIYEEEEKEMNESDQ
jgi:hypothetical protein